MLVDNVAKTLLVDTEGRVLLLRRSRADESRPGDWDLPGGGMESGEDPAAAAAREISEEAGLDVKPENLRLVYAATGIATGRAVSVNRLVYAAPTPAGQAVALGNEHETYRWLAVDEALQEFQHPVYAEALRYARDNGLLP